MKIAVIGGGAAGMMAALAASENADVTILERNDRLGKKLLSTGNGKCNFSHLSLHREDYYSSSCEEPMVYFQSFNQNDMIRFLKENGMLVTEKNACFYPYSEQAAGMQEFFCSMLKRAGVKVRCKVKVQSVLKREEAHADGFWIEMLMQDDEKGEVKVSSACFDKVILACGGMAAPKTGSDGNGYELAEKLGHSLIPVVPALTQLRCREKFKELAGIRAKARVTLLADEKKLAEECGELQLTDYGISGIVVFQISRLAAYALRDGKKVRAVLDFLPQLGREDWERYIQKREAIMDAEMTAGEFFTGLLHKKLMQYFMKCAGIGIGEPIQKTAKKSRDKVYSLCRSFTVTVTQTNSFEQAQVCAGGVPLFELTPCLESKKVPGLFFAGEMLDVDGKCGGFNLQWAWTSGYLAGVSASGGTIGPHMGCEEDKGVTFTV